MKLQALRHFIFIFIFCLTTLLRLFLTLHICTATIVQYRSRHRIFTRIEGRCIRYSYKINCVHLSSVLNMQLPAEVFFLKKDKVTGIGRKLLIMQLCSRTHLNIWATFLRCPLVQLTQQHGLFVAFLMIHILPQRPQIYTVHFETVFSIPQCGTLATTVWQSPSAWHWGRICIKSLSTSNAQDLQYVS